VTTNQPTNDQRRHDTAYLNKRLFYYRKVRRLIIIITDLYSAFRPEDTEALDVAQED